MSGFIAMPTMQDIRRLERRIADLEQWIKDFEAGKGATEVMTWPMPDPPSALNLDDPRHDANVVPCDDDLTYGPLPVTETDRSNYDGSVSRVG